MSRPLDRHRRFIASLEALADRQDRGALAALRRGLGKKPGEVADVYPYVLPWLPSTASPREEDAYFLVAGLFALHPHSWHPRDDEGRSNLGASFARLMASDGSPSIEKRFVALLNCHLDDLPAHLRSAVGLLKAHEIPIDWAQLLSDILSWHWDTRAVQREWARAFWGQSAAQAGAPGAGDTITDQPQSVA